LVSKDGHPWLNLNRQEQHKSGMNITIKELLHISGGWTEAKQSSTMYLDEFKSSQVQKLVDFIE
jgi:hypothetical protein